MSKRSKQIDAGESPSYLHKSIAELEGAHWGEPDYGSYVVRTIHKLREKPLEQLTDEELRLSLSQKIGLPWVLQLALVRLSDDPFRSGDFYGGDVLVAALRLPAETWRKQPNLHQRFSALATEAAASLERSAESDRETIQQAIGDFKSTPH